MKLLRIPKSTTGTWQKFIHFIYFNIISLLSKIEELRYIAKSANVDVIGICESKLDASVSDPEISIDEYKIQRCEKKDRQR